MVEWRESQPSIAGVAVRLRRAGKGQPLLVLPHDIGAPAQLPLFDLLATRFELLVPDHPGFGTSERPEWMRNARDLAVMYRWLLTELEAPRAALLGLGFGGWIAAEMASMSPADPASLTLVGPMGIKPPEGDIMDQAIVSYIDYARAGFHDQAAFDAVYGAEPSTDQLVAWDHGREMGFRIAWKPYMRSVTLEHLLGGIRAPTTLVWGEEDRVVPVGAAKIWQRAMPRARLVRIPGCGHCVDMEQPEALARLITA